MDWVYALTPLVRVLPWWPAAIVLIAWLFKVEIKAFISRIRRMEGGGFKLQAGPGPGGPPQSLGFTLGSPPTPAELTVAAPEPETTVSEKTEWLGFLKTWSLIEWQGEEVHITPFGRALPPYIDAKQYTPFLNR